MGKVGEYFQGTPSPYLPYVSLSPHLPPTQLVLTTPVSNRQASRLESAYLCGDAEEEEILIP